MPAAPAPNGSSEEPASEVAASEADAQEALDRASRKRMLIGIGGTILVLVVVFWFIFAFVMDPEIVIDAFLSLELWQLGVLALMAAMTYVFLGFTFKNSLRGLGIKDATLGMLDLAAAGVMIFRIFQWLIPIPIGYGLILYWQKRDNFNLLSADRANYQGDAGATDSGADT